MKVNVIEIDGNYKKTSVGPLIETAFTAWQSEHPTADPFLPDVTLDFSAGAFGRLPHYGKSGMRPS